MPLPLRTSSPSHPARPARTRLGRLAAGAALLVIAALVAVGCGGDGARSGLSMKAVADIRADGGPLRWLDAQDTWLVGAGRLDAKQLDAALETLDRLPAWSLAESFLPASDGAGLRTKVLELLAAQMDEQGRSDAKVSAKQLEAAFGEHFGVAITSPDLRQLTRPDQESFPLVIWIEVDDREAAEQVVRATADGTVTEREHSDVTYLLDEEFGAVAVHDELLLFASSESRIKHHIDVFAGTKSLAEDDDARAVIEAGINDSLAGVAVATDPLLRAAPGLIAEELDDDAPVTKAQLEQMFGSAEVDATIPDWMAMSLTVDTSGLRSRMAWSNPRELAQPPVSARELVERTPATTALVSAVSSDGSELTRVQRLWKQAASSFDLDLRSDVGDACTKEGAAKDRWVCALGVELLVTLLEDGSLARAVTDAPDTVAAYGMDVADLREFAAATVESVGADPLAALSATPVYQLAWSGSMQLEGWTPSSELTAAMDEAGLKISAAGEDSVHVELAPGSPIRRALAGMTSQERAALDSALGIPSRALLDRDGLTIEAARIDDELLALAFPLGSKPAWATALKPAGDAEGALGSDENYRDVVAAAGVPDEVGMYGYVGLLTLIDADWGDVVGDDNAALRALPAIRNNLTDVPGIVSWSERQEVEGEQVGLVQVVLPILE